MNPSSDKVTIPAVSTDEEGRKRVEKIEIDNRSVDTIKYVEKKLIDKGLHRLDRHPRDGLPLGRQPKGGHGGKYTWEGPVDMDMELDYDSAPAALDENDPNYIDEQAEAEAVKGGAVIGEVEVAKVAEGSEDVSRIDVVDSLTN